MYKLLKDNIFKIEKQFGFSYSSIEYMFVKSNKTV